ncbi:hypothetical protein DFH27DRAFT_223855 [Peziza echinospora]|nr:hypothetical protein DFH27DRAFT_223855 [Peziza echinospora]
MSIDACCMLNSVGVLLTSYFQRTPRSLFLCIHYTSKLLGISNNGWQTFRIPPTGLDQEIRQTYTASACISRIDYSHSMETSEVAASWPQSDPRSWGFPTDVNDETKLDVNTEILGQLEGSSNAHAASSHTDNEDAPPRSDEQINSQQGWRYPLIRVSVRPDDGSAVLHEMDSDDVSNISINIYSKAYIPPTNEGDWEERFYNTILHEPRQPRGEGGDCLNRGIGFALFGEQWTANPNTRGVMIRDYMWQTSGNYKFMPIDFRKLVREQPDYRTRRVMGPVHLLYMYARAGLLRRCDCKPEIPVTLMPRSPAWPGLEQWILQLLRCGTQYEEGRLIFPTRKKEGGLAVGPGEYLTIIAEGFLALARLQRHGPAQPKHAASGPDTYGELGESWALRADLVEIFRLVSWLGGVAASSGVYEFCHPGLEISRLLRPKILARAAHVERLGMCPQRIWALVQNTPDREVSMLTLVPDAPVPPDLWAQPGHADCLPDYCAHQHLDFTGVDQLHVCGLEARSGCRKTETGITDGMFPHAALAAAVERQMRDGGFVPTAWTLDGRGIVGEGRPFMAVSHVWSDGTGTGTGARGIVNECVYGNFADIARSLGCEGVWWDATCLPAEKKARIHAINNMHSNYARAAVTLVHDRSISTMRWITAAEASFALVMSPWFTRGWTALELAVSRPEAVHVLFADRLATLEEILAREGEVTHAYHHVASDLIRRVMGKVTTLNHLLSALGPRYTSWARDKAIIAGLLVGVPNPASLSQIAVYQAVIRRLETVQVGNLFHGRTGMQTSGFRWCPSDLFQMPPAPRAYNNNFNDLIVTREGYLLGHFMLSCLTLYKQKMDILPAGEHPLIRARTEHAIRNVRSHALVKDPGDLSRGLILRARLIRNEFGKPMECEVVGMVALGSPELAGITENIGYAHVLICDVGNEAPADAALYACAVSMSWPLDESVCACGAKSGKVSNPLREDRDYEGSTSVVSAKRPRVE